MLNSTWYTGLRLESRDWPSARTRLPNGISWSANASSSTVFTRPSSSVKVGSPDASSRSATVVAKGPINGSASRRSRPANAAPTTESASQ